MRNTTVIDPRTEELIIEHLDDANRIAINYATRLPHVDKEDLEGAAALGLVESASRYDHDRNEEFWTFARRRVQGAIQDYLRKSTLLSGTRGHYDDLPEVYHNVEPWHDETPETWAEEDELREMIRSYLSYLTERERIVVEMMYYEGRSAREIAHMLGISEARVSQLKSAGVRKLQQLAARFM